MLFDEFLRFLDGKLAHDMIVNLERAVLAQENDLCRLQRVGDLHGHRIGIDAVGLAVAVKAERRQHRDDPLVEEKLQARGVHALDLAGVELVDAAEDARGESDDGVGIDGAQVHGW